MRKRNGEDAKQPTKLRIAGQTVQMGCVGGLREREVAGTFEFQESLILLDHGMCNESRKATAVHEVVHAIDLAAGTKMEEHDVCGFGSILFAFIRDNPDFIAWVAQDSVIQR